MNCDNNIGSLDVVKTVDFFIVENFVARTVNSFRADAVCMSAQYMCRSHRRAAPHRMTCIADGVTRCKHPCDASRRPRLPAIGAKEVGCMHPPARISVMIVVLRSLRQKNLRQQYDEVSNSRSAPEDRP